MHTLRSSNLPFHSAVWDAAKSSTGLVTFNKRFYWAQPPTRSSKRNGQSKKECVLVDIVTQGGLEWVKVSTVTETRLLFQLAKAGWEADSSSSDDIEEENQTSTGSPSPPSTSSLPIPATASGHIELVRLASDLRKASLATTVRYKHPTIRFFLPKLPNSLSQETLSILNHILSTGAKIQYGPQLLSFPSQIPLPSPPTSCPLLTGFPRLLPDPHASFTSVINIDCTILLALISDLSHSPCTPHSRTHHRAITRQIALEAYDPLLPDSLYPALRGRDLVCTAEAATRMREIVAQIGSETEKARGALILGDEPAEEAPKTHESILARFASKSEYPVPSTLRLPIQINQTSISMTRLPPVAEKVGAQLTAINRSVFFYGWVAGITTVSSNRTVAKAIETVILEDGGGVVGPDVWVCETARSLIGKDNGRRG